MNSKHLTLACIFVFILNFAVFAQTQTSESKLVKPNLNLGLAKIDLPEYFKVGEVKGNIGTAKAIELYKPRYSDEAKLKGAEGQVKVEIEIEESGSVVSAKAVSGEKLLYESAQNAALRSKFLTPKIDGQRTKVKGVLNYNFYIEKPNWFAAVLGLIPLDSNINAYVTKKAFETDWQPENELIDKLAVFRRVEQVNLKPTIINSTTTKSFSQNSISSNLVVSIVPPSPADPEAVQISHTLLTLIQSRLANNELGLWQFNLNLSVFNAIYLFRDPNQRIEAIELLKKSAQNIPNEVSEETRAEVDKLIMLFEKGEKDMDFHKELNKSLTYFSRAKN